MTKTYILSKISQVVEIATKLEKSWFRGHPKVYGELTPKIFRKKYDNVPPHHDIEFRMIEDFKKRAPALSNNIPNPDNHISWLFLMQHYGTPTRLLDWTESALIALFFAVSENSNEADDGEIWAMYPNKLNEKSDINGFPLFDHPILRYIVEQPLYSDHKYLAEKLELKISGYTYKPQFPVAFQPPMKFSRMVAQMSTFTIHPKSNQNISIPELLTDKKNLVRYIVPIEKKCQILKDLKSLGINHHTLFPDLDSLSKSIIEDSMIVGYSPPEPPECDGEYES